MNQAVMNSSLTTPFSTKLIVLVLSVAVVFSGILAFTRQNILNERAATTSPLAIAAQPLPFNSTSVLGASTAVTYTTNIVRVVQQKASALTIPGAKHLIVTISITNHDSQPLQLPIYGQAVVVDSSRNIFQPTASYLEGKILGGPLAAGETKVYTIDYDVPLTSTPWEFIFQGKEHDQPVVTKLAV